MMSLLKKINFQVNLMSNLNQKYFDWFYNDFQNFKQKQN